MLSCRPTALKNDLKLSSLTAFYRWFSPDVFTNMLVHRTKERNVLWEFDSVVVQNVSHHLPLASVRNTLIFFVWPCLLIFSRSTPFFKFPGLAAQQQQQQQQQNCVRRFLCCILARTDGSGVNTLLSDFIAKGFFLYLWYYEHLKTPGVNGTTYVKFNTSVRT